MLDLTIIAAVFFLIGLVSAFPMGWMLCLAFKCRDVQIMVFESGVLFESRKAAPGTTVAFNMKRIDPDDDGEAWKHGETS